AATEWEVGAPAGAVTESASASGFGFVSRASMTPSSWLVPGADDRARKYELLPGLYQTSSGPDSLGIVAMMTPLVSLMMIAFCDFVDPLQPTSIWWPGPFAVPCGVSQSVFA